MDRGTVSMFMVSLKARLVAAGSVGGITVGRWIQIWISRDPMRFAMRSGIGYLTLGDGISRPSRWMSDEIGWDLMGLHEITQVWIWQPTAFMAQVVGLTPRDAGVNAVENSALTPWKSGVNPVENSGLTPRLECAENQVSACSQIIDSL